MDVLDSVRELGDKNAGDAVNINKARGDLHREITGKKSSRKKWAWSLGLGGATLAGGAAWAISALAVGTVVTVGVIAPPVAPSASAADLLERAAVQVEKVDPATIGAPASGQYTKVTVTYSTLMALGPSTAIAGDSPFAVFIKQDAVAGALNVATDVLYVPADNDSSMVYSTDEYHVAEIWGDQQAFNDAWMTYYGPSFGPAEEVTTNTYDIGSLNAHAGGNFLPIIDAANMLAVTPENYATDPQLFRDQWEQNIDRDTYSADTTTTAAMIQAISRMGSLYGAPPEYRATLLRALALGDDLTVTDAGDNSTTFGYADRWGTGSLTLDSTTGQILSSWFDYNYSNDLNDAEIAVGSSPLFPTDRHQIEMTATYEVVDSAPAPTGDWY